MDRSGSRFREIARSSGKVGVATVAGLVGWIVGGKVLALELGAAGIGIFGLLRQLLQNLSVYATFNGANALVQGVASRDEARRQRFSHTVACLFVLGAAIVAAVLLLGAPWLGPWLLPHPQGVTLLRWLALAVIATTAQTYFTTLLASHRAVNELVRAQLLAPATVLALVLPMAALVRRGQPAGLVLMLVAPGFVVAAAAMFRARSAGWFSPSALLRFSREDAAVFLRTSSVLLTSGLLATGAQYLLSRLVVQHLGLAEGGQFWVAWTLSMTYVTVLLGSYGTYYMPALSGLTERTARVALMRDYLRLALLVMPLLVSLVVVLKPWVVLALFSANLMPSLRVMRWMLLGDFLKGIAWVLAFPMLAFNEMRWFFWSEALFHGALVGAAWIWLTLGGAAGGLGMLFAMLYALYLPFMLFYVRGHGFRLHRGEVLSFVGGSALVAGVSFLTWTDERVRAGPVAVLVVAGAAYVVLFRSRLSRPAGASMPAEAQSMNR